MPRSLRSDFAGQIYHALNRGNARNKIFFKDADFEAFERVVQLEFTASGTGPVYCFFGLPGQSIRTGTKETAPPRLRSQHGLI